MSEFHVEVVRVGALTKHPNADSLSITSVRGYPIIIRTGDFAEGDLAVYVPVDAVVAPNDLRFAFLGDHRRIRAKRLRGVFSMGLLTRADVGMSEGDDVAAALSITKYEPPEEKEGGGDERDPGLLPVYDVEGLRRYPDKLVLGEEVVLTEKLHGENARYVHDGTRLWVGSRTRFKLDVPSSKWWMAARKYSLTEKLAEHPNIGIYGETHGYTGGFPYGVSTGDVGLRLFDAIDVKTRCWLDADDFFALAEKLGVPTVPVLFRGPWDGELRLHAEGKSTLAPHVREGFVVRPVKERHDLEAGRILFKLHGEGFLLR